MRKIAVWFAVPFIIIALLLSLCAAALCFATRFFVPLHDTAYRLDTQVLDFSGGELPELSQLARLQQLQQLDLRDTGLTAAEYEYLHSQLPQCQIQWLIPFQDTYLPTDTTALTVNTLAQADVQTILTYLPHLETLDAVGCSDYAFIWELVQKLPKCSITYTVPISGQDFPQDATQVAMAATTAAELAQALPYLPLVASVTVENPIPDPQGMLELRQQYPDIAFSYCFQFFGQTVTNHETELNISGVQLSGIQEFEQYMPHFADLQKVEMCQCGISNQEMDALNRRYPDIPIIWEVQIGNFFLRTDITYFMPWQYNHQLTDADADNLRYLTELIVLDTGHMGITRTDYLAYMTKLEYLLMCDCPITDATPIASMTNLKYAELFITHITDFSPLVNCKNLVDLNICYTYPEDRLIFAQMPWLEHLWMRGTNITESEIAYLREALPNTKFLFGMKGGSTGGGWRSLPNYFAQRDILGMHYMED